LRKSKRRKPSQRLPNLNVPINHQIRASELRVIGDDGVNYGVLSLTEALKKAQELEQDLIEISPKAVPPVAKIGDYGKFLYAEKKKQKAAKAKTQTVEVKAVQVKIGTGENDLSIKAKNATDWLNEGHRIKLELFLPGRSKYLDKDFLEARFDRFLKLLGVEYTIAQEIKKGPKGLNMILEKVRG